MPKKIWILITLPIFILQSVNCFSQTVNLQDSLALVDLYNSTNGSHWTKSTNWNTTKPVTLWYGVLTQGGRVTRMDLHGNNLQGSIPFSFSDLTGLTQLDLSTNRINGSIPSSIGNLVQLTDFKLNNNLLTGAVPSSIGSLVNLTELDLFINKLSDSLPSSIGNLVNLTKLDLSANKFTGSLPHELGNLAQLTFLNIGVNAFSGNIPHELGNLSNLTTFYAGRDSLTGAIPEELGNLSHLTILEFVYNKLSGPVPSSLGGLPLTFLSLSFNHLTDSLPFSLVNHSYNSLQLSNNNFTFKSIENIAFNSIGDLIINPQAKIPMHKHGNTLSVSAGGTLSNNTYTWYQNGLNVATIQGDSTFTVTSPGIYSVDVKNSIVGDIVLMHSSSITISTLPLRLMSFTGTINKNGAALQWQTTSEVNMKAFIVQRANINPDFTNIGTLQAVNQASVAQYNFTDTAMPAGISYYRLKMIDNDGMVSYSNIISIKNNDAVIYMHVYPNPIVNTATLMFNSASGGKYAITVTDMNGRKVQTFTGLKIAGPNKVTINMSPYATGTYIISVIEDGRQRNIQLLKAH